MKVQKDGVTAVEQVIKECRGLGKRAARIALWLFGTAAFLLAVLAAADVIHWHRFYREYLQSAELNAFPKPLPDSSVAVAQGVTTVTQSGCSVDLPWPNATVDANGLAVLPDKRGIFFVDPASAVDGAGIFRATGDGHSAVELMGASTLQSSYDLLSAELNVDPAELSPLPWGRKAARTRFFVISKLAMVLYKQKPIYTVAMGAVHGFQFGDNSQSQHPIELDMFDSKDRQFRVDVSSGNRPWTQPEINFMIQSMRCDDSVYTVARTLWQQRLAAAHR
jgi:hypothetical protein